MNKKQTLAMLLAGAMLLPANAFAASADDFSDFPSDWSAAGLRRAVDNGLLNGANGRIDGAGLLTRAQMAAIINRAFAAKKTADLSGYNDVSADVWYRSDLAAAVAMGTFQGANGQLNPERPITREEAFAVLARAFALESGGTASLNVFSDSASVSSLAADSAAALVENGYVNGANGALNPKSNITRAEFAQIFHNIVGTYIVSKGTYDKDIKGSILIRTDEVTLKDMTVDGDLIIGCGAADGKITLDNVTVKGRLLVWGGGTKAVYCNNGTQMPEVVVARVDDAVKVIYDRDSTLAVIDTIKTRITDRAKAFKETEIIFYDVSGLREAQKQLNAIVADNQIDITAPAHLYALVGEQSVKAEFVNNSKSDTYKIEIRRNKDNSLIVEAFDLAAGKSISTLTLLEAPEFGNVDCTVTIIAFRDGKQIGTLNTELTLHTAYLWPKEVQ